MLFRLSLPNIQQFGSRLNHTIASRPKFKSQTYQPNPYPYPNPPFSPPEMPIKETNTPIPCPHCPRWPRTNQTLILEEIKNCFCCFEDIRELSAEVEWSMHKAPFYLMLHGFTASEVGLVKERRN